MKIRKLSINEHKHLKDLEFDFTYPEGHEKAGQPLEKICIIGQSATGKTSVLQLIHENVSALGKTELVNERDIFGGTFPSLNGRLEFEYQENPLTVVNSDIEFNGRIYKIPNNAGGNVTYLLPNGLKLLYFSAEMISREVVNLLNKNPLDMLDEEFGKMKGAGKRPKLTEYAFEFSEKINEELWFGLLDKIADYRKKLLQFASQTLSNATFTDLQRLNKEYKIWSEKNKNPLLHFSEYFNPILERLRLEVGFDDTKHFISIKSKIQDEIIPVSELSTGTKSLLLSLFPLSELDTKDAMILVDEPERSLFPDIQIELVSHYRRISPESQLIIATHSPFIAAAFEPEERFILYFDKEGKVAVRRGESPIGDDPNDMLENDFKVKYYNEFGQQAYEKYVALKQKIASTDDEEAKKKLIVERAELGDKYNF